VGEKNGLVFGRRAHTEFGIVIRDILFLYDLSRLTWHPKVTIPAVYDCFASTDFSRSS